jgi:hypothetical protein
VSYLLAYLDVRAFCGQNRAVAESYYAERSRRDFAWRKEQIAAAHVQLGARLLAKRALQ